jgi:acetyl esterase
MKANRLTLATLIVGMHFTALAVAQTPPKPDPQMQVVLTQLAALDPKPIEKLSPEEARKQPTPADAVMALIKKEGKSAPEQVGAVKDTMVPGHAGNIPVRIYTPEGNGPFPVIVYIQGGGWVIATIDTCDASARAMTNLAKAVVVSVEYRKAPEHKFPAAHEDCYAATQYVMENAEKMNEDPKRVAIMGESAGGNMATAVCMMARDRKGRVPVYEALIYPVANSEMNTPSFRSSLRTHVNAFCLVLSGLEGGFKRRNNNPI